MKCPICNSELILEGYESPNVKLYRCREHGQVRFVEDEWWTFKKEAAVRFLSALISNRSIIVDVEDNNPEELERQERSAKRCAYTASKYVDALIEQLKKEENEPRK